MNIIEAAIGHDHDVIAGTSFRREMTHDVVCRRERRSIASAFPDALNDAGGRERLFGIQVRSTKDRRNDRKVGGLKGLDKRFFEQPPPASLRSRLKYSPDPSARIALPHGAQCLLHRSRVVRKVVVDADAIHFTAYFKPPFDALERG